MLPCPGVTRSTVDPDSRLGSPKTSSPGGRCRAGTWGPHLHEVLGSCPRTAKAEAGRTPAPKTVQELCWTYTSQQSSCLSTWKKKPPRRLPWSHSLEGTWILSWDTWLWRTWIHPPHVAQKTPYPQPRTVPGQCRAQSLSSSTTHQAIAALSSQEKVSVIWLVAACSSASPLLR